MLPTPGRKWLCYTFAVVLLAFSSGCALDVEMTSAPDSVHPGEPVTFDVKVTNRSQCPVKTAYAEIEAFIPVNGFSQFVFGGDIPPNVPPEVQDIIDQLNDFFDQLCTGGTPPPPSLPVSQASASCRRGDGEIVCEMTGAVTAHDGGGGMTFSGLGKQLQCEMDGGTIRCELHIPLGKPSSQGGGALVPDTFTCQTLDDLGFSSSADSIALCYLGTFPNLTGLDPGGMATGQISLPARGSGFVRNLVFATANASDDELGVCKGGTDGGKGCVLSDTTDCPGSTCGEGICDGGDRDGFGCDVANEATDCPNNGTCMVCSDFEGGYLPFDCTTTYVAPQPAPTMSPWGLIALAAVLLAFGSLWLQRRARRG